MANEIENEIEPIVLPVLNYEGEKIDDITLPADLFQAEINEFSVQRAIRVDLANRRVDTAHTLDRSVVHGSNRKPWRQKGTGRARSGTRNSPIFRHGGVVHGPNGEQNHHLKINKREHYIAYVSALSDKANQNNVIVITDEEFHSAKTRDFVRALNAIGADEVKNILVIHNDDINLIRAASNIPNLIVTTPDNLSVYDILNCNKLILARNVIPEHVDYSECECGCQECAHEEITEEDK